MTREVRPRLAVDEQLAGPDIALVVVREGRRAHHRRQQRVVAGEPLGPRRPAPRPARAGASATSRWEPARVSAASPALSDTAEPMRATNSSIWRPGRPAGGPPRPARRRRQRRRRRAAGPRRIAFSPGFSSSSSHTATRRPASDVADGRRQLDAPRRPARRLRPGEHGQQQLEVAGAAGHRPEHVDVGVGRPAADAVEVAALGHDAVARLEAERAAAVRRHAHRAADVGAELERRQPGRHRRRRTAGRAAGDRA